MPRGNGTGPMGMGPMTGRAAGYCAGQGVPGYMNPYGGRGMGLAWGRGGGRGGGGPGWDFAPGPSSGPYAEPEPTAEQQLSALREQADWLKQQLDGVDARVRELQDAKD